MAVDGEVHQNKRPLMASDEGSVSKKAMAPSTSPSPTSVVSSVKSEGEVAGQGGRASPRARGVVAELQANPPMEELPLINVGLQPHLLHCAVADCYRPLKPPVFKCAAGHRLCTNCGGGGGGAGHCRKCGRDTTFVHCGPDLDVYIGGFTVACPFQVYGCATPVAYHDRDAHREACEYAPCRCALCPFEASPPVLRDHLAAAHAWPVLAVPSYGQLLHLSVSAVSGPPLPQHRLLVVEGDARRVFVLSVRARGEGTWAVSLACVRASAMAGPRYTCTVWAAAPAPAACMPAVKGRWVGMETDVPICAVPGAVDEEGMALCMVPAMLVGPEKEMHLRVRIDEVEP